jgi:hypothetical protein
MSYLETIKRLYESIKNNDEISDQEKDQCKELLNKLSNLLALY